MLRICWFIALPGRAALRLGRAPRTGLSLILCGCLLSGGLLSGCALLSKPAPPKPAPVKAPPQPAKPPAAKAPAITHVAVVYAANVPVYKRIADELTARLKRARPFPLRDETQAKIFFRNPAGLSDYDQVVAIGDLAARGARNVPDKQLVFCQVFNYRDYGLSAKNIRGVSMLPPPNQQFKAWKALAPDIQRIGVITGPGHEALIAQAHAAAQQQGMELIHRIAQTDKETLYEFKRLVPDIDGLWLLPDDRILSHRVLRELMTYSTRHRKQVAVFHPQLLKLGGLISASSVEADIADQVLAALRAAAKGPSDAISPLRRLTKVHIEINDGLAHRLGYVTLPAATLSGADAR